jgi:hypothetical protein
MEDKENYALLKVIASSVETIKEDLKEMKEGLKGKVEVNDFTALKKDVEDLKKKSWFVAGIASAISFFASHFLK